LTDLFDFFYIKTLKDMKELKIFQLGNSKLNLHQNNAFAAFPTIDQDKINTPIENRIGYFNIYKKEKLATLTNSQPVYQIENEPTLVVATGDLYIEFKEKVSETEIHTFFLKEQLTIVERLFERAFIVKMSQQGSAIDYAIHFQNQKNELIKVIEPDLMADTAQYNFQLPSDELLSKQWYLENTGFDPYGTEEHWKYRAGADAKVIDAWRILQEHKGYISSENITIAVLDKGFDLSHPDFQNKIVGERDFNYESSTLISEPFKVEEDEKDGEGRIGTEADHGTSCAGIALAAANGMGVVGVAPNSKFMPIRYYVANGRFMRTMFRHIMRNGGDIASCSFGNIGLPMDRLTIKTLHEAATNGRNGLGMVIVFATGNAYDFLKSNELATHPDVIAVGATTSEDTFAPYTNRTANMSVVAPGGYGHSGRMTTTDVSFLDDLSDSGELIEAGKGEGDNPYYRHNAEGTSFACPVVAGVAALILSADSNLTAAQVKNILETTADKVGDLGNYDETGRSVKFGFGRVNAANAVRMALGLPLESYLTAPNYSDDVPMFAFDYGQKIAATHDESDEEVTVKYVVEEEHAGKNMLIELDVALNHNLDYEFEVFIQKDKKPVYFPEDFIDKKLGATPQLKLNNVEAGNYYIMLRCIDKGSWQYIKGGGDFELTISFEDVAMA
jgi:hypothetical protein